MSPSTSSSDASTPARAPGRSASIPRLWSCSRRRGRRTASANARCASPAGGASGRARPGRDPLRPAAGPASVRGGPAAVRHDRGAHRARPTGAAGSGRDVAATGARRRPRAARRRERDPRRGGRGRHRLVGARPRLPIRSRAHAPLPRPVRHGRRRGIRGSDRARAPRARRGGRVVPAAGRSAPARRLGGHGRGDGCRRLPPRRRRRPHRGRGRDRGRVDVRGAAGRGPGAAARTDRRRGRRGARGEPDRRSGHEPRPARCAHGGAPARTLGAPRRRHGPRPVGTRPPGVGAACGASGFPEHDARSRGRPRRARGAHDGAAHGAARAGRRGVHAGVRDAVRPGRAGRRRRAGRARRAGRVARRVGAVRGCTTAGARATRRRGGRLARRVGADSAVVHTGRGRSGRGRDDSADGGDVRWRRAGRPAAGPRAS